MKTKSSDKKQNKLRIENVDNAIPKKIAKKDNLSDLIPYKIRLLDSAQENLEILISKNDNGDKLFSIICDKLGGIVECDYFGLRYTDKHNQRQWLDLGRNVKKQLASSLSTSLSFRVKHYPGNPIDDFHQEISQYLLYLQIRRDLIQGRLLCKLEDIYLLGALILQAELGDAPENHPTAYIANISLNSSDQSFEEKHETKEFGPISSPISPDSKVPTASSNDEFFGNFKIVFNQTKKIESQILEKYRKLRGLTARDCELEIIKRASQLDTYGVDPFPVKIINKKSSPKKATGSVLDGSVVKENLSGDIPSTKTAPAGTATLQNSSINENSRTAETVSVYLGLRHTGLTTYVGLKPSEQIPWSSVNRLACDGKDFIVYVNSDPVSRTRPQQLVFRCESKAAALALWSWTIDRKSFFTLKAASEAKKTKSSSNIFRRSRSYRFIGKSQMELKSITSLQVPLPQPEFIRVSSLRRPPKTPQNSHFNQPLSFSTLPSRPKPSKIFENTDRFCESERRDSLLTPVVEQEPSDEIIETATPLPTQNSGILECLSSMLQRVMRINEDLQSVQVNAPETPIHPVSAGQNQTTAPASVPPYKGEGKLFKENEKKPQLRYRAGSNHDSESIRAVEAIDKALEHHEAKISKRSLLTKSNGEIIKPTKVIPDSSKREYISMTKAVAVLLGIFCIMTILVALETTRRPTNASSTWSNVAFAIRRQPLIGFFDRYVYGPVRDNLGTSFGVSSFNFT